MFAEAWRLGRRCVFWWQARHLQRLSFVLRGRRGAFSTSIDVCGSVAPGTPPRFVVPGVILVAAPQPRFAWPAWHFQYEHRCLRKRGAWDAAAFSGGRGGTCSLSFVLRGRRGVFSTSKDVCGSVGLGRRRVLWRQA